VQRQWTQAMSGMEAIQAEAAPVDLSEEYPQGGLPARNSKGDRLLLYLGVIDILQSYRLLKKFEHTWKSMLHDGDSISVHNPGFYAQRFQQFMGEKVFRKIPSPLKHSPSRGKRQQRRSTGESAAGGTATTAAASAAAKRTQSSGPEAPPPQPSPSATFGGPFPSAPVAVDSIDLVVDELPSEIFRGQVGRSSTNRRQTSAEGRLQRQDAVLETEPGGGPPPTTTTSVKRDGTKKFDRLFASDAPSEAETQRRRRSSEDADGSGVTSETRTVQVTHL